jgi:hypothetical protein
MSPLERRHRREGAGGPGVGSPPRAGGRALLALVAPGRGGAHAPTLLRYEVASALANALAVGQLDSEDVGQAWQRIAAVPVVLHQLDDGPPAVEDS